jgi:hypothetical protein
MPNWILVLLIELGLCAAGYMLGRRRGLATFLAHLLVLDFGWLAGVWARYYALETRLASIRRLGDVETAFSQCLAGLRGLGWLYSDTTCILYAGRGGRLELQFVDPIWWWGGVAGILLISVPAILFFWGTLLAIRRFLLPVRDAQDLQDALWCLVGFVIGRNRPYYRAVNPIIPDAQLTKTFEGRIVPPFLGPGVIMVNSHYAVPLTDGPNWTRVGAPRLIFTHRKERPLQVVDLRPHIRPLPVQVATSDGIEIKTTLFLVFRIDNKDAPNPTHELYPFSQKAVFAAIKGQKSGRDKDSLWDNIIIDAARGAAANVFSQYRFDQLIGTEARNTIRLAITERVSQSLGIPKDTPNPPAEWCGIQMIAIGMSNIEPANPAVAEWQIKEWSAPKAAQAMREKAAAEADAIALLGQAQASVQQQLLEMLVELTRGVNALTPQNAASVVLLRSVDMIERMASQLPPPEQGEPLRTLSDVARHIRRHD